MRLKPSLSGRVTEAKVSLECLRDELYQAALAERASSPTGDMASVGNPPWVMIEQAADATGGALKSMIEVQSFLDGAKLRGWETA